MKAKYKVLVAVSGDLSATGMSDKATTIKVEARTVKWVNKYLTMQEELNHIIPKLLAGDDTAKQWMEEYNKVWDIVISMVGVNKYFFRTKWKWLVE